MSGEAYSKAVDLLSRRAHFRAELEHKLIHRGFGAEEVGRALERLSDVGLLDDLACARSMTTSTFRRKAFGPRKIRAELQRRGAESSVIDTVLGEEFTDGEIEAARRAADRWRGGGRAALARHLEQRGFGGATVYQILNEREVDGEKSLE